MFVIIMMAKFRSLKQTEPYIVICLVGLLKGDEKLPLSYACYFLSNGKRLCSFSQRVNSNALVEGTKIIPRQQSYIGPLCNEYVYICPPSLFDNS